MRLNNFFNSGFTFSEEEYELRLQYTMHNSILKIVILMLSILTTIRLYEGNYFQAFTDIIFIIISASTLIYIRKSKKHIRRVAYLLLFLFYFLVSISFINSGMDVVGASWFIVLLLPAFYLAGIKAGVITTVASLISLFVLGQLKENSYTMLEYVYVIIPLVMGAVFMFLYEKRVSAAKEMLNQENRELAEIISKSNIELFIVDYDSDHYLYVNKGGLDAVGYTLDEMLSMSVYDINPTLTVEMVEGMKALQNTTKNIMNITQHQRKDGSIYGVESLIHLVTYKGRKAYVIYDINLIDQQKAQSALLRQKEDLLQKAHYDELTKLPNRTLFNDRLSQAIAKANRYKKEVAILFIDLDGFKNINDTLGHKMGDSVLCEVSSRFQTIFRKTDTISRFGGDEFVCIMDPQESSEKAFILAQKLIDAVKEPMEIDNQSIVLTCSIGISIYPKDAKDATELLHHADSAMYKAKDNGKDNYMYYKSNVV